MPSKVFTVVGATGLQGGSVVRTLMKDGHYHVRALTRNPKSARAEELTKMGVEVVQADSNDYASVEKAFAGSHAIFALTDFVEALGKVGATEAMKLEIKQGLNMARAAAATSTLEHYIWSTLPNSTRISHGTHHVVNFDGKAEVDDYIKSNKVLFNKTTFFWITMFAQNMQWPMFSPVRVPTSDPDTFVQIQSTPSTTPIKTIGDAPSNIGPFVKAIVEQPKKTLGRFVMAHTEDTTSGELLATWAKALGKKAYHVQTDKKTYYKLWPPGAEEMDKMLSFWSYAGDKSWSGEEGILTKDDLNVTGLVGVQEAFAAMQDWE